MKILKNFLLNIFDFNANFWLKLRKAFLSYFQTLLRHLWALDWNFTQKALVSGLPQRKISTSEKMTPHNSLSKNLNFTCLSKMAIIVTIIFRKNSGEILSLLSSFQVKKCFLPQYIKIEKNIDLIGENQLSCLRASSWRCEKSCPAKFLYSRWMVRKTERFGRLPRLPWPQRDSIFRIPQLEIII